MLSDTSLEARQIQTTVHRKLGGPRRLELACRISDMVRELARVRIRAKHPEFDETEVREWLIWELYGVRRKR